MIELLSNRFLDGTQTALEKRHEATALQCLEQWRGTPEEFGATLEEATSPIDSWLHGDSRGRAVRRKALARSRIVALAGGRDLIRLELHLNYIG
jgi:hypothetical protein